MSTADAPGEAASAGIYTNFDAFLKAAIHDFYRRTGKRDKATFIALVIASGELPALAGDAVRSEAGLRKLAMGAAGVAALRVGLRYLVSGPLGILLTGAAAASMVAYFVRNRAEITSKVGRFRTLVTDVRQRYEDVQSQHRDGRLDDAQRNLMIDGLRQRFLADVEG